MPDPEQTPIVVDPIEEALANQVEILGLELNDLDERIASEEAMLSRMRASAKSFRAKSDAIRAHLDENFEGWEHRLSIAAEVAGEVDKRKRRS